MAFQACIDNIGHPGGVEAQGLGAAPKPNQKPYWIWRISSMACTGSR